MNCYIVRLRPFGDMPNNCELLKFEEDTIQNGVSGMGWNDSKIMNVEKHTSLSEYSVYDTYKREYKIRNDTSNKFVAALNIYREMEIGDYLLTRTLANKCYIGKIIKTAFYNAKETLNFLHSENYSWIVNVNWKEFGEYSNLPNALRGELSKTSSRYTAARVKEDGKKLLMKRLYEGETGKIKLTSVNYASALDPNDLEDLVAFFIYSQNPGYQFVPSSCKISEPNVEYKLVDGEKTITCQVKNQRKIDVNDYAGKENDYEKIYLFSAIGYTNTDSIPSNVIFINPLELFDFFKRNYDIKGYFYYLFNSWYMIE